MSRRSRSGGPAVEPAPAAGTPGGATTRSNRAGGVAGLIDRLPARLRGPVRRGWHSVVVLLPTAARLPAVGVDVGRWLPCWSLRLVAVALALASSGLGVHGAFGWTVAAVLSALILVRPGSPAAVILACVLGFSLLQAPERPWAVAGPLMLLGLHACVTLCLLLGATAWSARVQPAVLVRPAGRFVVIQLIAQLLGAGGALLAGRELSWPWVPLVAALAGCVLAYVWIPLIGRRPEPASAAIVRAVDASTSRRWGDE